MRWFFLVGVAFWPLVGQSTWAVDVEFIAESENHGMAVVEYREIWREDGTRIVDALSEATGLTLSESRIRVIVREGISRSGTGGQPMFLRASYPIPTKRATLVHELGHRYLAELDSDSEYSDIHFPLSLLLYQVWSDLWGEGFALSQARVEAERSKRYRQAWNWLLSMRKHEREEQWEQFLEGTPAHPPHQR